MLKRALDIIISGFAMLILLPFLPPLALLLKLTGEGEIFYIQPRMGRSGRTFGLVKFATMLKESPNLPGGVVTLANDPRVLPLGRLLRKTRINELPQLWNIFKGDMSFVGPRPLAETSFDCYPEEAREAIKALQPGLTGIGSVIFCDEDQVTARSSKPDLDCYYEDILPYKGELEIWYKENQSLWLDLKLTLFTIQALLFPKSRSPRRYFRDLPEWPESLLGEGDLKVKRV